MSLSTSSLTLIVINILCDFPGGSDGSLYFFINWSELV